MNSTLLASFTAKNSKSLKFDEVQLLGDVVGLPFLKKTFITEPLGKGFEVNDAFRVKVAATGLDATSTDAVGSLDINVAGDNLSLAISSNLLDSTALRNALIAAKMAKVMNFFHTDAGQTFGNDIAGTAINNNNKLRLALNYVSPPDADAFDDAVSVPIMPENAVAILADKNGIPLIWNPSASTPQWETSVNNAASGTAADPWVVVIVASGTAAAVNLESTNSYVDLDEYTKCALAVSPKMMKVKSVKLLGSFNQINNSNIVKVAKYYNAKWNTTQNQLEPATMSGVESSEILKVAKSFTGYSQTKWQDIDGINGLSTQCKIQFVPQLLQDFTSTNTTPYNNTQYTNYIEVLASQNTIGLTSIKIGDYNINAGTGAIPFVYGLLNLFPNMTSQQADRALSTFTATDVGYSYVDSSNVTQTVSGLTLPILAKRLISGASVSGAYEGNVDVREIGNHADVENYVLTGANFHNRILATASTPVKNAIISQIFDGYLEGNEELLNGLVDAVHLRRPDQSRDAIAVELAANLNGTTATTAPTYNSRLNRFPAAPTTKQTLLGMLHTSYNARNGNDALANQKIVKNLNANGFFKVGPKTATMDSSSTQDADFGLYSCFDDLVGNNTLSKDVVKVNSTNADGSSRTQVDKMQVIANCVNILQSVLGLADTVATQCKWSSMASANGAAVFTADDLVVGLDKLFTTRAQQDLVGEFRSTTGTTGSIAANLYATNLSAGPIHMNKLNGNAANRATNKRALWLHLSQLADVQTAGTARNLVAKNACELKPVDGLEIMKALYGKNGQFVASVDNSNVDFHNSARLVNELLLNNAESRWDELEIDPTHKDSVPIAFALQFATTTTSQNTAPSPSFTGQVVINQFVSGTTNSFANMASIITASGSNAIKSFANDFAPMFSNSSFNATKFVSEVGTNFNAKIVYMNYVGNSIGDEEIGLDEAKGLMTLGFSKSDISSAATLKFELLPDGRSLAQIPTTVFFVNRNNLSAL